MRAVGASVAATVGVAGTGAAAPGCVVTVTDANAYNDCPGSNYVWTVAEGTNGFINQTCYDGTSYWHEVTWECDETWTVHEDDVVEDDACYC